MNQRPIPLCVDLDGTLTYSDLLYESLVKALKTTPWILFFIPFWLLKGKAYLKYKIASFADLDIDKLPYNNEFIDFLQIEKSKHRELILVTASNQKFAEQIAAYQKLFSRIIASDSKTNIKSSTKAEILTKQYGEKNFDYAGNETADYAVWEKARYAIVVNASRRVTAQAKKLTDTEKVFPRRKLGFYRYIKAIRAYQWVKNSLLFVPLISSQLLLDIDAIIHVIIGFFTFSLTASLAYIINDLSDLDADRGHYQKRNRPFAAGTLSIKQGLMIALLLLISIATLCLLLPTSFVLIILLYFTITMAYSLYLKTRPLLDVFTLAGLYTVRVIAGALAIKVMISFWLLGFSIFIFLSLAIVKRTSELLALQTKNIEYLKGRDYSIQDLNIINAMGVTSGYASVLVLALYINSDSVIGVFDHPELLWFFCPMLLYWISRVWLRTSRGEIIGDPIIATLRDHHTIYLLLIGFVILALNFLM